MLTNRPSTKSELNIRTLRIIILTLFAVVFMITDAEIAGILSSEKTERYLTDNNINNNFRLYKRHYKFYNHCSERQLQIIGNSVTALGSADSPNSNIILQSANYNNHYGINIIGERSGKFLCFSKKGKLITRFSGLSPRCIFEELFSPDEMYTTLRSVFKPEWAIGFNRWGKPIVGSKHAKTHRSRCFYFSKRGNSYVDFHKMRHHGPRIKSPNKLMHLLPTNRLRKRKLVNSSSSHAMR